MPRRRDGIGMLATAALMVVWFMALSQVASGLTVPFRGLLALGLAALTTWGLNVLVSAIGYYRESANPLSLPKAILRYADSRTPATNRVARYAVLFVAAALVVSATVGTGVAPVDSATPSYSVDGPVPDIGSAAADSGGPTSGAGSPPDSSTDAPIKTVEASSDRSLFRQVVLHESGRAKIRLAEDHACADRIALVHATGEVGYRNTDDAIAIWQAPQFSGPLTVDLGGAIPGDVDYPSRRFKLVFLGSEGEACVIAAPTEIKFRVPGSYL